jgi:hypothetical protein
MTNSTLTFENWTERVKKHAAAISPWTDAFIKRQGLSQKHPVHDFLFTYYSCSPKKLKQWVPSFEEILITNIETFTEYPWLNHYWFKQEGNLLYLDRDRLQDNVKGLAAFTATLCQNVLNRAPRFGCFGLHEWAMVYKSSQEDIRYTGSGYRLRLLPQELATFVESQKVCCTHYDAFRFFTPEAKPLNTFNPTLDTRLEMEQGGCIHANMDLYKWATKLWPWVGSDFIAKTFFHALECREIDMRASPYDLSNIGFQPICIETEEGRKQYQIEQQRLAENAIPLREELKKICEKLVL